jgi:hypothetical protein
VDPVTDTITRNSLPPVALANLQFVTGYEGAVPIETILHPQFNGSGYLVVWRPARLRTGILKLVFPNSASAWTAAGLLSTAHTYTLAADVSELSMSFVLRPGELKPYAGAPGGKVWLVDVPFQEVTL